jgi:hypothetical protein
MRYQHSSDERMPLGLSNHFLKRQIKKIALYKKCKNGYLSPEIDEQFKSFDIYQNFNGWNNQSNLLSYKVLRKIKLELKDLRTPNYWLGGN